MRVSTLVSVVFGAVLASNVPNQNSRRRGPAPYAVQTLPPDTDWTYKVGTNPWTHYPRPKLQRSQWKSLNGIWTYQNASSLDAVNHPPFNQTLSREVLVPFCLESALSGIQDEWMLYSWYRTIFTIPSDWTGNRVLLNFGAVDYEATVFVNGENATFNRGGYFAFSVDITRFLKPVGTNELIVFVHDPTDSDPYVIPIGKQTLSPSHIFYRPCSGIWQSVWVESAPSNYLDSLDINGNASGQLNVTVVASSANGSKVDIAVFERGTRDQIGQQHGIAGSLITFKVNSIKTWSPTTPILYDVEIKLGNDTVKSYTGFRSVAKELVNGVNRIVLNGDVIFPMGTLDQGYWPDGLYTAPTYEAMRYDIQQLKKIGYNMLRKHIKVEPALFYSSADELGILIVQDMPALRPSQARVLSDCTTEEILPDAAQQQEFQRQLEVLVTQFRSYTSIFAWVIYNEGWGQVTSYYPEFGLTDVVRSLDPTRLIDSTTGWYDHGAGDFSDNHHYSNPQCGTPFYSISSSPFDPSRIGFQGEFGGIGYNVSADHLWKVQEAVNTINQTYEIDETLDIWNYRGHVILNELRSQIELYSCAGAVWTQTTDVEGEVNGMLTYDRRLLRPVLSQWNADIQALYDASAKRTNASIPIATTTMAVITETTPWPQSYWSHYTWTPAGPAQTTGYGSPPGYQGVPGGWAAA